MQRRKKIWGGPTAPPPQALVAPNHLRPILGILGISGIFHHRRPPKTIGFHSTMANGKTPHDPYDLPSNILKDGMSLLGVTVACSPWENAAGRIPGISRAGGHPRSSSNCLNTRNDVPNSSENVRGFALTSFKFRSQVWES